MPTDRHQREAGKSWPSPINAICHVGFTLVELVVILVVIGVLAVAVMPRFADQTVFEARGFHDETLSTLRYAQKTAVAQRRTVCVTFAANSVSLRIATNFGGACDRDLAGPNGSSPYQITANGSAQFSPTPAAVSFNPDGSASAGASIQVSSASSAITLVKETGYVY
jgi:MSHA pilin protein MshC